MSKENLIKQLLYRSNYRGCKETDILLGKFFSDKYLELDDDELEVYRRFIEEDDMFEAIRRAKGRLVGFHVADNNRMAPGMGRLDWKKIVATLREIGYNEVLSVEFCSPLDRTPANPYPNSIEVNPEGLSPEAKKFLEDHGSSAVTEDFYAMLTRKSVETLRPLI